MIVISGTEQDPDIVQHNVYYMGNVENVENHTKLECFFSPER